MKTYTISAPKIIAVSFLGVIIAGALLLTLPISTANHQRMPVLDAVFTSVSAVCVTGLAVVDIGTYFSYFGQIVILILIQIGGLGIMTFSTFFLVLMGKKILMRDSFVIASSIGKDIITGVRGLVAYTIIITAFFEIMGAAALYFRFITAGAGSASGALYSAVFHSVSAFNNAGLSLYGDSLMRFQKDWVVLVVIAFLIIFGGLGFLVLFNLNTHKFWKKNLLERGRIRLQSKMALLVAAGLIVFGMVTVMFFEYDNTLSGLSITDKIVNSFFQSVTPRTAGFNSQQIYDLARPTIFITMFLMFIGGSPGSTAGGIKTCTFLILIAGTWASIRGRNAVQLFGRTISAKTVQEALCVLLISSVLVCLAAFMLLISENDKTMTEILFEVLSAFGNVGLSMGITSSLSSFGKVIILLTMFIGRISPLSVALIVGRHEGKLSVIRYPEEPVMVG